jgi:hypothetical protein
MKISILLIGALLAFTVTGLGQGQVELDAQQHNGFFLRLLGGVGSGKAVEEDVMGSDIEFEGTAGVFRFQIGGVVSRNLGLYGEVGGFVMSEPDVTWQGHSGQLKNTDFSVTDIGAGISYYFMPSNIYLSATLTMSRNTLKAEGIGEAQTEAGLGVYLSAGKEWWVSNRWGLGVAIFGSFSQSKDKGDSVEYTIKNRAFGVLFSATFD